MHDGQNYPDLVLIYIGFNDFGNGIKITSNSPHNGDNFFESYFNMLMKIQRNYPRCRIICGTLMESCLKGNSSWLFPHKWAGISIHEYNAAIKSAAKLAGVDVADLASLDMKYEILDGTHPTKAGHNTIAQAWIQCLRKI